MKRLNFFGTSRGSTRGSKLGTALLVATTATGALAGCGSDGNGITGNDPEDGEVLDARRLKIVEDDVRAFRSPGATGITIHVPVTAEGNVAQLLTGSATLRTIAGETVAQVDAPQRLLDDDGNTLASGAAVAAFGLTGQRGTLVFEVPDFADTPASTRDAGALANLVIDYEVRTEDTRVYGHRSLFTAWDKQSVQLFSTDEFAVGGESYVRVIAVDPSNGDAIEDAVVSVGFHDDDGAFVSLATASTDAFGVAAIPVPVPESLIGQRELVVEISNNDGLLETLIAPAAVAREQRIMITTDKPIYQPGQTIHLRSLTLDRRSLRPSANAPVLIEIKDAEGNKVGRIETVTDDFGIAATEFTLARELNQGTWTIAATVDGVTSERDVTVGQYVLPKFNVVARPDAEYYRPGDTAVFTIDSQYFFGQPVAGGAVLVEPFTFDVGFTPLPPITTTLNDDGITIVEVPIPSHLVGLPLEQGDTFVRVDISVTDATGHTQTSSQSLAVANADAVITVVPATSILPGQDTVFYVITSDPVGRPLGADVTLTAGSAELEFTTNARGMGEFTVRAGTDTQSLNFTLRAESDDVTVSRDFSFNTGYAAEHGAISLRTDAAVYEVGDSIEYDLVTGADVPRVFVDVIRAGQTLRTATIELENGRAHGTILDLGADMTGTLQLDAYLITTGGDIVRSDALVWVDDANALDIALSTPEPVYRPGDEAQVDIRVTDEDGQGVVAAVGLTVVDEAVFALQDMRPGLERIFFQLEEELLNPSVNLYNLNFESIIAPDPETTPADRNAAAAVLLAATETAGYPIHLDTLAPAIAAADSISRSAFNTFADVVRTKFIAAQEAGQFDEQTWESLSETEQLIDRIAVPFDPWGQPMRLQPVGDGTRVWTIMAESAGLDERWGTDDDLTRGFSVWDFFPRQDIRNDDDMPDFNAGGGGGGGGGQDAGMAEDVAQPSPPTSEEGESAGPRVRSFFPETLLVEPSVITGPDGNASVPLSIADSITSWRMTGTANTADGRLGSGTGNVTVFQDFFVDINFPVSLTQNDIVSVPVALFNYLDEPQTVTLAVDMEASGDWFTLLSDDELEVALEPGEITVRYFEVQVERVGRRPFQVTAIGSEMSDAIRRVVEVVPDGQEQLVVFSDRLNADVNRTVTIPAEAIDEASALFVKLYPGLFSQVIEGLDSLLQMPSGCFEQTSSTTYPNVLVMQYLLETGQSSPELEMLATEYISQGYQRLVSYEVPGGGFEWFGNDPAHRILSAYGLLEFSDMADVFPVDPAVIDRTRNWLLSQQEADGRWRAAPEGIHEGATNNFQDSDVRATAYLTYALLESGDRSPGTLRGVEWVRDNVDGITDAYSLGLIANMLLSLDNADVMGRSLVAQLDDMKVAEETDSGMVYHWESESQSLYYGSGDAMTMETTAFILQAFILAGTAPETIEGVVGYLIQNKGQFGQFSSTQATIHALRAFVMLLQNATSAGEADIAVFIGDTLVDTLHIDAANSDLMRQFDLRDYVIEGDNDVTIEIDGEGEFLYQIVGRYYLPWELVPAPPSEDIVTIDVAYDRTELAVDDTVLVTTTVRNETDGRLDMVMVDLGVPPGFDVAMGDFDVYVNDADNPVSRVERAGRQLTVYLYGLDGGEELVLEHHLQATMPMEANTPASAVWLYYDDSVRTEEEPVLLTVN